MAVTWRHRTALIQQWNRINLALTARVLTFMYGPDFPQLKIRLYILFKLFCFCLKIILTIILYFS